VTDVGHSLPELEMDPPHPGFRILGTPKHVFPQAHMIRGRMIVLWPEDYVVHRNKEDRLDEFDTDSCAENLGVCVDHGLDCFNDYLNITEAEYRTALRSEEVETYRRRVRQNEQEVQDWHPLPVQPTCGVVDTVSRGISMPRRQLSDV
jgi:hypothetical protein